LDHPFSDADLAQLRQRGIRVEEAQRQLRMFEHPPAAPRLDRPCTIGDGIDRLPASDDGERLALHAEAAREGRLLKFVPASGAATRMFRDLLPLRTEGAELSLQRARVKASEGDPSCGALVALVEEIHRLPFHGELRDELARRERTLERVISEGACVEILDALLDGEGLGYASLSKGLLKFHRHAEGGRTPFEEHLVEAAQTVRDASGRSRVHFTVASEHLDRFRAHYASVRESYERKLRATFEVGFSIQEPSTDTLAVDPGGRPFRDEEGRLLFRPGGHGALLHNLAALEADIVLIRNIDNVAPEERSRETWIWKKMLAGHLLGIQRESFRMLARLDDGTPDRSAVAEATEFAGSRLHVELPARFQDLPQDARRDWLVGRLRRPLRACGVVRNTGEPGGGPFWVCERDGTRTLQIVERAQVDAGSKEQKGIFEAATHFNPVDIACGLRDDRGAPFDLSRYVDDDAVILTGKSFGGRELRALERPGLWNGAMAGWNTVFVEAPAFTFTPVKTVNDLLRPEHQPD
jgi:hypothetical protein